MKTWSISPLYLPAELGHGLEPLRWRRTLSTDHHPFGSTLVPGGLMEGQGKQTFQEGKDNRSVLFLQPVHFLF